MNIADQVKGYQKSNSEPPKKFRLGGGFGGIVLLLVTYVISPFILLPLFLKLPDKIQLATQDFLLWFYAPLHILYHASESFRQFCDWYAELIID